MKLRQLQNYLLEDGEIPKGTYIVEGELKIVRFYFREGFLSQHLYKTYHNGETVNIKEEGRFYCVFYEKVSTFKNRKFIESYLHRTNNNKKLQFLSMHYRALKFFILKEYTEQFYLEWIFKMKEEPERLEVWKGDKHILNLSKEASNFLNNPKDYHLVSYIY